MERSRVGVCLRPGQNRAPELKPATRNPGEGARNSGEERVLPECKVEEACTENILGAAFAGVQGLTTSEKLEKMGRDGDAINGTRKYFGE